MYYICAMFNNGKNQTIAEFDSSKHNFTAAKFFELDPSDVDDVVYAPGRRDNLVLAFYGDTFLNNSATRYLQKNNEQLSPSFTENVGSAAEVFDSK
jgi:hypothetical protein